jgi:hypothetical protein
MKKRILFYLVMIPGLLILAAASARGESPANPKGYLKGYNKTLKGGDFTYHSPQPNVSSSLLVRSIGKELFIEWETEPIPSGFKGNEAKFIFLAAIDVNRENAHSWNIYVDDKKQFTISSPPDASRNYYSWTGADGYTLEFKVSMTDQHGDQHGYMVLTAPGNRFEKGRPLKLKAEGESANSPTWFMIFKYGMEPWLNLVEEQAVTREGDRQYQQVRIEYVYMGDPVNVLINSGDVRTVTTLNFGYNTIRAKLPVVKSSRVFPVSITRQKDRQLLASNDFELLPVIPRTIHLLHHSHVDIGYTHVQDEVKEIQWKNLEDAVKLASETSNFPEGARFKWNSEVMWPIESYMREKEPEKVKAMKEAVLKGWIELDAFYANELTELCTSEELIRLTSDARSIAAECGVKPLSAMITDIPGWSWGIVPVLARSGVKYLSLGTNSGHRIGSTIKDWGDRPFYWVSPSGEEKILCWIHEKAYSLFHTGLKYSELKFRLDEGKIFGYMNELCENGYPYEIITLRYNIGSDNGPADFTLSQAVKAWNEKYVTPLIKIMTVSESFSEFETRYGDRIPSVRGAYTGYWEDGAASSALETAMNRQAAENINSAGAIMVMNNNRGYDRDKIDEAWRNVLFFNEHTWGSWNSISEPQNPFTLSQWKNKRQFAVDALDQGKALLGMALGNKAAAGTGETRRIEVINTHSWPVTDLVTISPGMRIAGTRITGQDGKIIPSQLLSSGELVFVAENIPPFGSRIYSIEKENREAAAFDKGAGFLENDDFLLKVNSDNGSIGSLVIKSINTDIVDRKNGPGLNSYYYVAGRSPSEKFQPSGALSEVVESGPVTSVIKVTTKARGSYSITSYYQLVNGLNRINISTLIDKENIFTPEGVHLGFPFNVPGGVMHLDLAFGAYRPESDQLKAACKNYLTPERYIDISNQNFGITWITRDAPLIEIGDITTDATAYGWISNLEPAGTFYSYVMNNYWETNYKASQEGKTSFRYSIFPHGIFISSEAEKLALQESEPLVVNPVDDTKKESGSLFTLNGSGIIVTALVPVNDGYLIRLFNAGGYPSEMELSWPVKPAEVYMCDFDGNRTGEFRNGSEIPAWGIRTVRVRR